MSESTPSSRLTAQGFYDCWFAFNELYALWAKRMGMNTTVVFCLFAIRTCGGIPTPTYVAQALRLSKQTVNSALDILEKKGYVTRRVDPLNRRSRQILLTPSGEKLADEAIRSLEQLEERVFGRLTARDRKSLLRVSAAATQCLESAVPSFD